MAVAAQQEHQAKTRAQLPQQRYLNCPAASEEHNEEFHRQCAEEEET
jgi:hypothetical protein